MKKVIIPELVFLVALIIPLIVSMRANDGHFVYTLDDPYIHLALSENIASGHYGINQNEFTAPSSSAIWPFLLVPFSFVSAFFLVPLLLNTIFALITVYLLFRFFGRGGLIFAVSSIFAFNLPGLALTGMEHSLQLLLVVVIAKEVSEILERDSVSITPLLAVSLVLGPLIRYECLAVSIPVLAFLFAAGKKKKALILFAATVLLLGAFSAFLVHLGLSPLPASVNAKSAVVSGSGSIVSVLGNLLDSVKSFRGIVQLLLILPSAFVLLSRKRSRLEKLLACAVASSVILHLAVGRSGWFHRYAVYMWAFSVMLSFYFYRDFLYRYPISVTFLLLVLSADYLSGYTNIADASGNIYSQQYQMRRFVHEWLQEPVAVNDLGLVSMNYDEYVLDLWGLATPEALQRSCDPGWVDSVAIANGVNTAIVYREEIPGIQHWTYVARMEISPPLVVCVSGGVDFLSAPWASADSLRSRLSSYSQTLPYGIDLVIFK